MHTPYRRRRRRRLVYSDSYLAGPWSLILTLGLLAAGGYGVMWGIGKFQESLHRSPAEESAALAPSSRKATPRSSASAGPAPAAATAAPSSAELVLELNLAVASRELARLRGDAPRADRQDRRALDLHARLRADELSEPGVEYLEPSDEIVAVDGVELRSMPPEVAAHLLERTLVGAGPDPLVRFRVLRRGSPRELTVRLPYGAVPDLPGSAERLSIPNDLAREVQKEILSLPEAELGPQERRQIQEILGRGEATREEMTFLTRRLVRAAGSQLDRAAEREDFRRKRDALEKMLAGAPVPDVVATRDGRRVAGSLSEETPSGISLQTPYAKVIVPRDEVAHLYPASSLREEFRRRFEGSRENLDALAQLLTWCRDWHLSVHREYVAFHLLFMDPEHRLARMAAGYYQVANGWIPGPSIVAGTRPAAPPPAQTRSEIRPELEALGFVFRKDRWYSRTPWSLTLDTLHQPSPEVRVTLAGAAVVAWYEEDTPLARLVNPTGKPSDGSLPRLRFLAPTGVSGTASITVESPGEIFECRIKAIGTVVQKGKGMLEVVVIPEGGTSHRLYALDQGAYESFVDATAALRGTLRFSVSARMTTTQDSYRTYARFLTSLPDSREVFAVRATILRPAPDADRTWLNARP
jgi:hypothetical protein